MSDTPKIGDTCTFYPADDDPLHDKLPYLAKIVGIWPAENGSIWAVDLSINYGVGLDAKRTHVRWWRRAIDGVGEAPYATETLP